jgi:hypothetical protein
MFDHYNEEVKTCSNNDERIVALARLLMNLAYTHPLGDRNGRSRLLLLQFELRRAGIACGTMAFNNGKNVYYDTLDSYVERIKEGIQMYDDAMKTGKNPWASASSEFLENRSRKYSWFPSNEYKHRLGHCWYTHTGKNPHQGSPF